MSAPAMTVDPLIPVAQPMPVRPCPTCGGCGDDHRLDEYGVGRCKTCGGTGNAPERPRLYGERDAHLREDLADACSACETWEERYEDAMELWMAAQGRIEELSAALRRLEWAADRLSALTAKTTPALVAAREEAQALLGEEG